MVRTVATLCAFSWLMALGCSENAVGEGAGEGTLPSNGAILSADGEGLEGEPGEALDASGSGVPDGGGAGSTDVSFADVANAGIELEFTPNPLDFGVISVGSDVVLKSILVRNPAYELVEVSSIKKASNVATFLLSDTSLTMYGKGEETLDIFVNPKDVGVYEDELYFLNSEGLSLGTVVLRVTIAPPECQDIDGDLHGEGCPEGEDCNESDPNLYYGAPEVCDGQDNDCDGIADEDFVGIGNLCQGGLGECVTEGSFICNEAENGVICSADVTAGGAELCNGIDDDCDGATDESFPDFNSPCFVGVGACKRLGKLVCGSDGTKLVCDVAPGDPTLEECFDEVDNDCDGVLDEGDLEICGDELDNDCDGETDESGSDWGEVFFARSWKGKTVAIYPSNGDGTFDESYFLDFPDQNYYSVAAVGDFDGDLYLDLIVVQNSTLAKVLCDSETPCPTGYLCRGGICAENCKSSGSCSNPAETCVDTNYNSSATDTVCLSPRKVFLTQKGCEEELKMTELMTLEAGENLGRPIDSDGNGHLDFVALGHHSTAQGISWMNDGNLGYTRLDSVFDYSALLTWKYTLGEASRDFNGDGLVDVIAARFTSGGNPPTELFLIEGKGDGTFLDPVKLSQTFPYPANLITGNDFDGDGDQDLVGGLDDDGQPGAAWMLIHAASSWLPSYPIFDVAPNMNSGGEKPGFGNGASFDFNGDDYPDVLVAYAPEECGSYVWGCTQVSDPTNICYGGNCRKVSIIPNRTGSPCEEGEGCVAGACQSGCVPDCENKDCGGDGCYGGCGTCEGGQVCSLGKCVVNCIPDCLDKECGDNHCGGTCGSCGDLGACVEGACVSGCQPNCAGKQCGDDGCGGVCTIFGEPEVIVFNDNSSLSVSVPTNVPPTLPTVGLYPIAPSEGDGVECVVLGASLDLDPVTYIWRWYREDVYAKEIGNVPLIPPGVILAGETWRCEAQGTDGLEFSPVGSISVVVSEGE